ncbi:MAG: DUF3854 domain-containing protein [Thermomicrobiales bacterium]
MTSDAPLLLPPHQALLDGSGIDPDVVVARGYRSITTKAEMQRLGFSASQARVPALLIPVHDVLGQIATYQARPDEPRIRDGKPLKYETPRGSHMVLDVPPGCRTLLGDPSIPLFITEGARKADAAASHDLCCIAVLGVWNWRGTNAQGGKVALPDFEVVALNGRDVYLVFDSDVVTKPAVRKALDRLAAMLRTRGATVRIIQLPAGPGGVKVGLDDFLVGSHTVTDLLAHVVDQVDAPDDEGQQPDGPYWIFNGGIVYRRGEGLNETWVTLTNFAAEIREEIVADDGLSERGELLIAGTLANGRALSPVRVPTNRFESLQWVTTAWGTAPIIVAGSGNRDRVREAIQRLSPDVIRRREYTHPGWRRVDGVWMFLTQDAVLGPTGVVAGIVVRLDNPASGICLPAPSGVKATRTAILSVKALLDLAPRRLMVPLIGAIFRALLIAIAPVDFALFLVGPSGVMKSELAAVIQRAFGVGFDRTSLPASWAATPNFLERVSFDFKDCLLVIDDFAPAGSPIDVRRYHATADRVIRGAGNAAGRGRMQADGSVRPSYPPRALILGTGEDIPSGYSIRARMLVLEVGPGDVNPIILARYQDGSNRECLAQATGAFVIWLAGRIERVREDFGPAVRTLRGQLHATGIHARTPDALAQLGASWQLWIRFGVEAGAFTRDAGQTLWAEIWQTLVDLGSAQSGHLHQEDPVQRFLDLLTGAIASGAAHIAGPTGDAPDRPEAWGWRPREIGTGGFQRHEWQTQGRCAGWLDDDGLFLEPNAAYHVAQHFGTASGTAIAIGAQTLWKRLDEAGLLVTTEQEVRQTRTVRRTLAGARRKVLHLSRDVLSPSAAPLPADSDLDDVRESKAEARPAPEESQHMQRPPNAADSGQDGRVGQALHRGGVPEPEHCVYCGVELPPDRRYVCLPCAIAHHGAVA